MLQFLSEAGRSRWMNYRHEIIECRVLVAALYLQLERLAGLKQWGMDIRALKQTSAKLRSSGKSSQSAPWHSTDRCTSQWSSTSWCFDQLFPLCWIYYQGLRINWYKEKVRSKGVWRDIFSNISGKSDAI